jgi:hypothetical protein
MASVLRAHILPVIVDHVNNNPGKTSVLALEHALSLPTTNNKTPEKTETVPDNKSRKQPAVDNYIPGKECAHLWTRGNDEGKYCGRTITVEGSEYCTQHAKDANKPPRSRKPKQAATYNPIAPGFDTNNPFPDFPPGYTEPTLTTEGEKGSIDVDVYDEARGWFIEPKHKFLLIVPPSGVGVACIGREYRNNDKIELVFVADFSDKDRADAAAIGIEELTVIDASEIPEAPVTQVEEPEVTTPPEVTPEVITANTEVVQMPEEVQVPEKVETPQVSEPAKPKRGRAPKATTPKANNKKKVVTNPSVTALENALPSLPVLPPIAGLSDMPQLPSGLPIMPKI